MDGGKNIIHFMVVGLFEVCSFNGWFILSAVLVVVLVKVAGLIFRVVIPITLVCTDLRERRSGFPGFRWLFGSINI